MNRIQRESRLVKLARVCLAVLLVLLASNAAGRTTAGRATAGKADLSYGDRGNRHEGKRSSPVNGNAVELLGAMVAEQVERPERVVTLSFFLPEPAAVAVTVREWEPNHFYWLDRIRPARPFRQGAVNSFAWPVAAVIGPLAIDIGELVAVARLGGSAQAADSGARRHEKVVPVTFAERPKEAVYRFTFKANGSAQIGHGIYGAAGAIAVGREVWRPEGLAFDVEWDARGRPEGWYRLVLSGHFEGDNDPVDQIVDFYHAPVWPR